MRFNAGRVLVLTDPPALAMGTQSANTTPLGFLAEDSGVEVVQRPNRPTVTPPNRTVWVRGKWSRNAPTLFFTSAFSSVGGADTSGKGRPEGACSAPAAAAALCPSAPDV
jgi:hypothetical protein